jgi:hypothetical protein
MPHYQWPPELVRPPRDERAQAPKPPVPPGSGSGGEAGTGPGVMPGGGGQTGPGSRPGSGSSSGGGGSETQTGQGAAEDKPVDPNNPDPNHPQVAAHIRTWITAARPPENAVPGNQVRYSSRGKIVGKVAGGIIKATHDSSEIDPKYLWANMRNLDSVDHCTLGEYVAAKLQKQSISSCKGRYGALRKLKGVRLEKAKAEVRAAGFQYEVISGSPAKKPEADGTVERQEPGHDQHLKKGQTLMLVEHAPYAESKEAKNAVKAAQDALAGCDFTLAQRRIIALHKGDSKTGLLNDLAQRRAENARISQQMKQAAELIRRDKYDQAMQKLESAKGKAKCADQTREIEKLIEKAEQGQEKNRAEQAAKALESCELQTARDLINRLNPGRGKKKLLDMLAQLRGRIEIADSFHSQAKRKIQEKGFDDAAGLLNEALIAAPCESKKKQIRTELEKIIALAKRRLGSEKTSIQLC